MLPRKVVLPILAAVVAAAAVSGVGAAWVVRQAHRPPQNLHDIVHERFGLTAAEHQRLDAAEARYAQRRGEIEARIHQANASLAAAIRANPQLSPDVMQASEAVEAAVAELQRVTLQHIFEMRAALDPTHQREYDDVLVSALTRDTR